MLLRPDVFARLCRARARLREDHDPAPSIADVAREARISTFHFIRQFEAVFGVTPHQFRIQSRLERARHLLARGQHSVTEVCMEVGFSSLGSFSGLFTRRVGSSPSAYRRRVRAMVTVPGRLPSQIVPGCFSLMAHLPSSCASHFSRSAAHVRAGRLDVTNSSTEAPDEDYAHEHHG